ncbi:hypothetical protein EAS62_18985 [Bradyrhizobium zhanjiangense]|uniref:Uncharacterized protein n=1 Tax=Bradyrhizobium zhanjiangense TaxID=1325107 RepID=A0ABY0DKT1_9BRAD|nr:hypothetical protein EAS62_18985 [Bradyrhizobium zhanjiangense]
MMRSRRTERRIETNTVRQTKSCGYGSRPSPGRQLLFGRSCRNSLHRRPGESQDPLPQGEVVTRSSSPRSSPNCALW